MVAIESIVEKINEILSFPVLIILILAGVYLTIKLSFFQFRKFGKVFSQTIFKKKDREETRDKDKQTISQFQAMTAVLAGTLGTGNIVGVSTAIAIGGAGAVFWMWIAAIFGMMTSFAENVLGIIYRYKDKNGEFVGGPMIYLEKGLKSKFLAVIFSISCILASFGIGNMTQINSAATSLKQSFNLPLEISGIIFMVGVGFVIVGGVKRIASVTEKVVPFMAVLYTVAALIIVGMNIGQIGSIFAQIFSQAFSLESAGGGIFGFTMIKAMHTGVGRGVFSNEAGLGSAVIMHCSSETDTPARQGFWGMFEVFFDTIIMCTITALVVLCAKPKEVVSGAGEVVVLSAFESSFGDMGKYFLAISIAFFAFSTVIAWSYYGQKCTEYLFSKRYITVYKMLYIAVVFIGATSSISIVWGLSDIFNSLMILPNIIGVLLLSKMVEKEAKLVK